LRNREVQGRSAVLFHLAFLFMISRKTYSILSIEFNKQVIMN